MATAAGYAQPQPAIPKTLGILNIIFAVLLILFGLCVGGVLLLIPTIQQLGQKSMEQQNAQAEAQRKADLRILDERVPTATTDAEKASIAREREALARRQPPKPVNPLATIDVLKNPTVLRYTVVQVVTGLALHLMMLAAGIGLVRLAPWGRTLGLWWAGLQVAQLLVLGAANFAAVLPVQHQFAQDNIALQRRQMEGPNPPAAAATTLQAAEVAARLAIPLEIVKIIAGLTYPIICLVLLRTAGARAACPRRPVADDRIPDA